MEMLFFCRASFDGFNELIDYFDSIKNTRAVFDESETNIEATYNRKIYDDEAHRYVYIIQCGAEIIGLSLGLYFHLHSSQTLSNQSFISPPEKLSMSQLILVPKPHRMSNVTRQTAPLNARIKCSDCRWNIQLLPTSIVSKLPASECMKALRSPQLIFKN